MDDNDSKDDEVGVLTEAQDTSDDSKESDIPKDKRRSYENKDSEQWETNTLSDDDSEW